MRYFLPFSLLFIVFSFSSCAEDELLLKNVSNYGASIGAPDLGEDEEIRPEPAYFHLATGSLNLTKEVKKHSWPFTPLSIGHSIASYQYYGGDRYFHHGIDPRQDAGTDILASAGGKVVNIENYGSSNAYWEVAILDDEGFLWQYHHVDPYSIPDQIRDAYKTGVRIEEGTKLGEIYYWPTSAFGERFHHIHLNIIGDGGIYYNPLAFLQPLDDNDSPQFEDVGILKNGNKVNGTQVSGSYSIYAKVHDLMLHDKFVLPPYHLSYSVDGQPYKTVWQFDSLPGGSSSTSFVSSFYVLSMTCGNYNCRELTANLGFQKEGNIAFPSEKGPHQVEIMAKDFYGQTSITTFDWTVQ